VPCGSQVVSYGTLGSPEAKTKLLAHPLVQKAAHMEGLVPAQVLMKWALQKGAALKDGILRETPQKKFEDML